MPDQRDFFISYNQADRAWAEWIAWQLEEAGFTVVIQAWDFGAGSDFVAEMDRAAKQAERTIAVLSDNYLASEFCAAEWHAAFADDPTGRQRKLIPVRVRACDPTGLLKVRNYIDLVATTETAAREILLAKLKGERAKPSAAPTFPGAPAVTQPREFAEKPAFPGLPPVWRVPRQQNPHFVGRAELLVDIRRTLQGGQAAALTALHGMGGVGKTQLAAEYAYAHSSDYQAVWWVNAETETTLVNDLAALAGALELPERDAREIPVIVAAVLRWLNGHAGWLLIFDNATTAVAVRNHLPQARGGHVLLTSRDPNWRGVAQALEVATLDTEAGAQFLLERTGQPDTARAVAETLTQELGGLPLALEQAGAFCEATQTPLGAYLRLFRQRGQELLARYQPGDYNATVATTWDISFEAAQREFPAAALLHLLSFCAPEPLPLSVLREGGKHLPEELAATVADELALADAIAALRRYSLLTREDDSVTLHRLVQMVTRARLDEDEQRRWAEAALRVVNAAFPEDSHDVRTWNICALLLPHAQAVTDLAEDWQLALEDSAELVNQMGAYAYGRAQYADAQAAFERALRLFESDDPAITIRVNNLGVVLQALGDLAGARQCFERALRLDEAAFGPDHPRVAIRVNNLGGVLRNLGDLAGAREYFERALRLDEAAFGPDHPRVAIRVNNLGRVLYDLSDLAGAQQCFERALRLFESHLGNDHPNVATLFNNLGNVLQDLGDLAGARQYYERALNIDEAAFGAEHPSVAVRVNNLGSVLRDLGDMAGARQYFERALHICTATLGAEHPHTVHARKNLAALG